MSLDTTRYTLLDKDKMTGPFLTRMSVVEPAINLGLHKGAILDVYFAILIAGGQIGLPITLLTMFFNGKGSRRHPTLINVLVSWMLYAIVNLLLCVFSCLFSSRVATYIHQPLRRRSTIRTAEVRRLLDSSIPNIRKHSEVCRTSLF